jgi:hypothetical protein
VFVFADFALASAAESCAILGRITMHLLQAQSEKPIKVRLEALVIEFVGKNFAMYFSFHAVEQITQFWANYRLADYVPKRAALELLAGNAADDNGHAAVCFIGHDELLARQFISRLVKLGVADLATRLILRYDLQDDQQFRYLFDGAEAAKAGERDADEDASNVAYLELPVPAENVMVVSTPEQISAAAAVLMHLEAQVIGLDAEWRPFATGSAFNRYDGLVPFPPKNVPCAERSLFVTRLSPCCRCSLLQLATEQHAILFDLMALERWEERDRGEATTTAGQITVEGFNELITSIFESKTIVGEPRYPRALSLPSSGVGRSTRRLRRVRHLQRPPHVVGELP